LVFSYALYLYFLGLSLRSTSKALEPFVDRSYVAIWYWIQQFDPKQVYPNKKKARITAFIIDETMIQIGNNDAWFWVAVEPIHIDKSFVYVVPKRKPAIPPKPIVLTNGITLLSMPLIFLFPPTFFGRCCRFVVTVVSYHHQL
jgi:hypothetical protein